MKQVFASLLVMGLLGLTIGCNGGSKAPTGKAIATPIQTPGSSGLPVPPAGSGSPFKK